MKPLKHEEFIQSLNGEAPKASWSAALKALWFDANNDWANAHDLVDQLSDLNSKWVHAYLHRKEGDEWNADYWYRQAGKPFPKMTLEEEFERLVKAFL